MGVAENIPFFSNTTIDWSQNPDMLNAYTEMLTFHSSSKAARMGEMESLSTNDVLAFTRSFEQEEILVIDNLRNSAEIYDVPAEYENTVWTDAFDGREILLGGTREMGAFEYVVLRRNN